MGLGEAAISCDVLGVHRAHCVITLLTPQWDTCSVLMPNCPIRDFSILFCFILTLSMRMLVMMARAPGPGVWTYGLGKHHSFSLPLPCLLRGSEFLASGRASQITTGGQGSPVWGQKWKGPSGEDCQGAGIQKYGANWQIGYMFLRFVCF